MNGRSLNYQSGQFRTKNGQAEDGGYSRINTSASLAGDADDIFAPRTTKASRGKSQRLQQRLSSTNAFQDRSSSPLLDAMRS